MIESDVISKQSAAYIINYLVEVKDRGVIGDLAWCKIALSVLSVLYFSDFFDMAHKALKIGKQKARILNDYELEHKFDSISSHWQI